MDQDEKDIELIEAFHRGKLTSNELSEFERRRETDQAFSRQVEDYIQIMQEVRSFGEQDFLRKLDHWERDITGDKNVKAIPLRTWLSVAAAILIMLIPLGYFLLSDQFTSSNEQLFATYFTPYDDVISERSGEAGTLERGLSEYNQKNFGRAVTHFEDYLINSPDDVGARTYLGISYLAKGDADVAAEILKETSTHGSGLFKEVSEWYLALAYLSDERPLEAKNQLRRIVDQRDHLFRNLAEELLEKIE